MAPDVPLPGLVPADGSSPRTVFVSMSSLLGPCLMPAALQSAWQDWAAGRPEGSFPSASAFGIGLLSESDRAACRDSLLSLAGGSPDRESLRQAAEDCLSGYAVVSASEARVPRAFMEYLAGHLGGHAARIG